MKIQRHAAILRVVRERRIESQDELREALTDDGFVVTQATLSRDIRELQLMKGGPDGAYQAPAPSANGHGAKEHSAAALLQKALSEKRLACNMAREVVGFVARWKYQWLTVAAVLTRWIPAMTERVQK